MSAPIAPRPLAGLLLGVVAVALFGATVPITRWTLGSATEAAAGSAADWSSGPLSPMFITFSRVVLAAALSAVFLLAVRARWPQRDEWRPLALASLGNAVLYPLSLAIALQQQTAAHVAIITALLPLASAIASSLGRDAARGSPRFWLCALASTALVVAFLLQRSEHPFVPALDDLIVLGGVIAAAFGYVHGAAMTQRLGAERVICWVTLLALPVSLPLTLLTWPSEPAPATTWGALAWLGTVSMWAVFFFWYRALHWGGPLRVSQTQALQPFFSIALAWPLLGERPDALTVAFALAVVTLVAVGTRR
jgi:drug/metabolite transporter (DMT)-like permease